MFKFKIIINERQNDILYYMLMKFVGIFLYYLFIFDLIIYYFNFIGKIFYKFDKFLLI